jgi:hypothetical protein
MQETRQRAEEARALWRSSVAAGKPITGAELGRRFGMSDRWGQARIAEAKQDEAPDDTQEIPAVPAVTQAEAQSWDGPTTAGAQNPQTDAHDEGREDDVDEPTEAEAFARTAGPRRAEQRPEPAGIGEAEDPLHTVAQANGHGGTHAPNQSLTGDLRLVSTSSEPESGPQEPHALLPQQRANDIPQAHPHDPQTAPQSSDGATTAGAGDPLLRDPQVTEPSKRERRFLIALTLLVLVPGLGISAWSFYGYGRDATAPMMLAMSASIAIDGIGLFAAFFAARFTNRGQSARFPRLVTYAMIVGSVYINWEHASSKHWSNGLHVFVSAPAVAAAFAFEILMLELRVKERARHGQRRRARQAAKVEADMWMHHPFMVWGARRWENRDRINDLFPGYANRKK